MVDREVAARWISVTLGAASAGVTAYWLVGGTALLATVGGEIERRGRERSAGVLALLAFVLVAKLAIAGLPLAFDRLPTARSRRLARLAAWAVALLLGLYGGVLTAVGLLVQLGVVPRSIDADDAALAWHAFFWDPWFLLWGLALAWWLRASRAQRLRDDQDR